MMTRLTREAPQMHPQHNWTLQDGQVTNTPRPTLKHSRATGLASGTHNDGVASLKVHIEPLGADDLIDDVEFWQTEQGFDTIDIHEQGSSFWVGDFPEFDKESCVCQSPLYIPYYQSHILTSNMAKSHKSQHSSGIPPCLFVNRHAKMGLS
jgi:hypothetical protein